MRGRPTRRRHGVVQALRTALLAPGFTAALREAALAAPGLATAELERVAARVAGSSSDMARASSHVTTVTPKTGERREA